MSVTKPYLLLDAGGTLVFPDQDFLIEQAHRHGLELDHPRLFDGYCRLIYDLDRQARADGGQTPPPWPQGYVQALLELLEAPDPVRSAIVQAARERHHRRNLWTFTFDWMVPTLARLAEAGYRMAVVSNSDGRTEQLLAEVGLAPYLERVFDSHLVGLAKPDPAIFHLALAELGLEPAEALYVGDVFYIDVAGANRAGLGCLHLDPAGLYRGWPGVHLPDLRHLPGWLAEYAANPATFELIVVK